MLTTVSPKYAEEIQTPEFGKRSRRRNSPAQRRPARHSERRRITPNGILRPMAISQRTTRPLDLSGKRDCRKDLLHAFGLDVPEQTPVIGICSRFASQKGFDLLEQIAGPPRGTRSRRRRSRNGRTVLREILPRLCLCKCGSIRGADPLRRRHGTQDRRLAPTSSSCPAASSLAASTRSTH